MIHNLFLTDHGLKALDWAAHVLNVCVKGLFGTILIIPLARKLDVDSLDNALTQCSCASGYMYMITPSHLCPS